MNIPSKVKQVISDSTLDISMYDFRNVKYMNKLYTIHYSQAQKTYYATFTAHINYPSRTPVLFTYEDYTGYKEEY